MACDRNEKRLLLFLPRSSAITKAAAGSGRRGAYAYCSGKCFVESGVSCLPTPRAYVARSTSSLPVCISSRGSFSSTPRQWLSTRCRSHVLNFPIVAAWARAEILHSAHSALSCSVLPSGWVLAYLITAEPRPPRGAADAVDAAMDPRFAPNPAVRP